MLAVHKLVCRPRFWQVLMHKLNKRTNRNKNARFLKKNHTHCKYYISNTFAELFNKYLCVQEILTLLLSCT